MVRIMFVEPDGTERSVEARDGLSVMEVAINNGVKGVLGDCGGACSCSTCHCYVECGWIDRLPQRGAEESSLLDFAWESRENSRLTCQITVTDEVDGLVLRVPEQQLS